MSVQPPSKGWTILGAMFLGCGGVLLLGLGGICSYVVGSEVFRPGSGGSIWPLLLLSLAIAGGGVALIYRAIKLLRE